MLRIRCQSRAVLVWVARAGLAKEADLAEICRWARMPGTPGLLSLMSHMSDSYLAPEARYRAVEKILWTKHLCPRDPFDRS